MNWWRASLESAASDRRAWLAVFVAVLPVYLLTAHYAAVSVDTASAVAPAWQLVHHGNVWVEHMHPRPYWSVPAGSHMASNRMPGVELVNVPFVALLYWLGPSQVPGALTAAVLTAATVGFLFLLFRRLTTPRLALVATAFMAFGTSLWTIASAEIWTHTVDALCLAVAMYAVSRQRFVWAGVAFAVAITARPHVALIALVVGAGMAWSRRSLRVLLAIGVPATVGLTALLTWNHLIFSTTSVSGGYAPYAESHLTQTSAGSLHFVAVNVLGFLVSPQRGLVMFLPLAALLVLGARAAWREAPSWVRAFAAGGVAYTLLQLKINDFGGGDAFYGYRLATELVVAAAPLAVVACRSWVQLRGWRLRQARALAAVSVGLQAVGAFAFVIPRSSASAPWRASPIVDALAARPAVALLLLLLTFGSAAWLLQPEPTGLRALQRRLASWAPEHDFAPERPAAAGI